MSGRRPLINGNFGVLRWFWTLRFGDEAHNSQAYFAGIEEQAADPEAATLMSRLIKDMQQPWRSPGSHATVSIYFSFTPPGRAEPTKRYHSATCIAQHYRAHSRSWTATWQNIRHRSQ
jgi:hypothetical protein